MTRFKKGTLFFQMDIDLHVSLRLIFLEDSFDSSGGPTPFFSHLRLYRMGIKDNTVYEGLEHLLQDEENLFSLMRNHMLISNIPFVGGHVDHMSYKRIHELEGLHTIEEMVHYHATVFPRNFISDDHMRRLAALQMKLYHVDSVPPPIPSPPKDF